MSAEDFDFAVSLTDVMSWNLARGDFEFMVELEPEGCFVLLRNGEKIGIVTTVIFDSVGWFGNLIVSEAYRKKGAGSMLASYAIRYLIGRKVKTIGLYAYVEKIPFYRKLGFAYDSDFVVINGEGFASPTKSHVRKAEKTDIEQIIKYDHSCLGFSRRKLLEPILLDEDNLCYISECFGDFSGYVVAKVYRGMAEIGPLICQQSDDKLAINLLATMLDRLAGFEVSMCAAERSGILTRLKTYGFTESFHVARMFQGSPLETDCICMAESLERG